MNLNLHVAAGAQALGEVAAKLAERKTERSAEDVLDDLGPSPSPTRARESEEQKAARFEAENVRRRRWETIATALVLFGRTYPSLTGGPTPAPMLWVREHTRTIPAGALDEELLELAREGRVQLSFSRLAPGAADLDESVIRLTDGRRVTAVGFPRSDAPSRGGLQSRGGSDLTFTHLH